MKIYHTADVHIGLKFGTYDSNVARTLIEERFEVVERMVAAANAASCAFFVVAGDLFDTVNVADRDVRRTAEILAQFHGEAVLVLAGNHDHTGDPSGKPWSTFTAAVERTNIYPLVTADCPTFTVGERTVKFYACPCPAKTANSHVIGWVANAPKDPDALHIGIAHGNVAGLSLDANHAYYTMTEQELRSAGCTTWLLGHVHVPTPQGGTAGTPAFFMPGSPAPDSVRQRNGGHAFIITFHDDDTVAYASDVQARIAFQRYTVEFSETSTLAQLQQRVRTLQLPTTVLDLQLSGALDEAELMQLKEWIAELRTQALCLKHDLTVTERLSIQTIRETFPTGTLPERLLSELSQDHQHPNDVHLAYEILKEIQR